MPDPLWLEFRRLELDPDGILEAFELTRPGIPIEDILWRLGITVHERPTASYAGILSSQAYPPAATIMLRGTDPPARKRYTLAHELGHLMLHPLGRQYRDRDYRGEEHSQIEEAQANRFAADLLMPMWMMDNTYWAFNGNPVALARIFGVSLQAMTIRCLQFNGVDDDE